MRRIIKPCDISTPVRLLILYFLIPLSQNTSSSDEVLVNIDELAPPCFHEVQWYYTAMATSNFKYLNTFVLLSNRRCDKRKCLKAVEKAYLQSQVLYCTVIVCLQLRNRMGRVVLDIYHANLNHHVTFCFSLFRVWRQGQAATLHACIFVCCSGSCRSRNASRIKVS